MAERDGEKETKYTADVICPHCFAEFEDSSEFFCNDAEDADIKCSVCDKDFYAIRHINVDYSTCVRKP